MIRINLLPYRATRKKENIRIQVNIFIGSLVLIFLAIFWFNSHLSGKIGDLNSEIKSTKDQVAKYQEINKEIAEIKKKLEVLDRKIEVIESLERDRKAPVQNLDSLYTVLVEKRMWYTQIEEKENKFKLNGVAIDNQTVADYMTRLEKSDQFENVVLSSIKAETTSDSELSLKQFEVTFQKKKKNDNEPQVKK